MNELWWKTGIIYQIYPRSFKDTSGNGIGDLSLFKKLIEALHKRGIRILMDLVLNHTSDQHPWFIESRSNLLNPKRNWYIWHPGNQGKSPNNWSSYFGGRAWHLDSQTGQYYLAMFAPEQPDLNWRNPEVKSALFDVMKFWLDQGVDGFRLDVFNQYFKDAKFRSNPIKWNPLGVMDRPGQRSLQPCC